MLSNHYLPVEFFILWQIDLVFLKRKLQLTKRNVFPTYFLIGKSLASMNKTESQEKLIKLAHLYEISRVIQRAQLIVELCQQIVKSLTLVWCQSDYIFSLMEINNQCLKLDNFTHALDTSSVSQEDIRKSVDFDGCIKIAKISGFLLQYYMNHDLS